jgi:short-subunit dehydrogenase
MSIDGAVVLVTGASGAIGGYLGKHFATCGARVVLTGRDEERLAAVTNAITSGGGEAWHASADLCSLGDIESLIDRVAKREGRLDILINNAADVTSKPFLETTPEEIEWIMRTNVVGNLQLTRIATPLLQGSKRGSVVNISSLAGYKANPAQTVYSISKAAVNASSEALGRELSGSGIHVMNVALAGVAVNEPPQRGQVPVSRVAAAIEQGLERREAEVFLSPITKWLMRLYRFWPALARVR